MVWQIIQIRVLREYKEEEEEYKARKILAALRKKRSKIIQYQLVEVAD